MNTFVQQCLSRLAASLGIGCAMLLVGWWCLTIQPVAGGLVVPHDSTGRSEWSRRGSQSAASCSGRKVHHYTGPRSNL